MALIDEVKAAIEKAERTKSSPLASIELQIAQVKALVIIAQAIEQSAE